MKRRLDSLRIDINSRNIMVINWNIIDPDVGASVGTVTERP